MENKLTTEQALNNLAVVVETQFRGTRNEHIALQESLELLKNSICKCESTKENTKTLENFTTPILEIEK